MSKCEVNHWLFTIVHFSVKFSVILSAFILALLLIPSLRHFSWTTRKKQLVSRLCLLSSCFDETFFCKSSRYNIGTWTIKRYLSHCLVWACIWLNRYLLHCLVRTCIYRIVWNERVFGSIGFVFSEVKFALTAHEASAGRLKGMRRAQLMV